MIANRMVIINKGETLIEGSVHDLLNSSNMVVKFQLDDVSRGEKLLVNEFSDVNVSKASTNELEFEIEKMRIADVAECFVKNNLRIYSIEQKRKLEDYFINMIAEG
jgi:ABC-type multidrug transport system ATPase subunit